MAGVSMRGSDEALARLKKRMDAVKSRSFQKRLFSNLAADAISQVAYSFENEVDPYDRRWAPIQRPGQILSNTGRLRNSFSVRSSSRGYDIGSRTRYASFHQEGTGRLKKRSFLPSGGRLGTRWRKSQEAIANVLMRMELGQKAGG